MVCDGFRSHLPFLPDRRFERTHGSLTEDKALDSLTPRQLMILNKLGQHADELRILVHSRPRTSNAVTRDCHPVSHPMGGKRSSGDAVCWATAAQSGFCQPGPATRPAAL